MTFLLSTTLILCVNFIVGSLALNNNSFPPDFMFGVGTSSYQIEGAWNVSGRSKELWDYITHDLTSMIADGSNGDVTCDSYHKLDDDIAMLKNLGVDFYRFSMSWSRLVPTGNVSDGINPDGVRYYHEVLDKLKEAGIEAMVTISHSGPPENVYLDRFLLDESLNTLFVDFARLLFELYGDKVKYWCTFNEPTSFCDILMERVVNYSSNLGVDSYNCGHNLLKIHAMVYHMFDKEYRQVNDGKIFITLLSDWSIPATTSPADIAAAERKILFNLGWFGHPVIFGDYPEVMKERVALYSPPNASRLPEFTDEEKEMIKGTTDFIGLNHYTSSMVSDQPNDDPDRTLEKDIGVLSKADPSWEITIREEFYVVPSGMREVLKWVQKTYKLPIFVQENGYVDAGGIEDDRRVNYIQGYLSSILDAIYIDGVDVLGYTYWSMMDNFEFIWGYTEKFGIYSVDFSSPNRERTEKWSAKYYKKVLANRSLVVD